MKKTAAILIVLIIMAMGAITAEASSKTRISAHVRGIVSDYTAPLEGVSVRVSRIDGSWFDGTYTNDTGNYFITLHGNGDYRIEFLKEGYLLYLDHFTVVDYQSQKIDPDLTPRPAETETLFISLNYMTRTPAEGKHVTATFVDGNNLYRYSNTTDTSGQVSWDVFPAKYRIEVEDIDLNVFEEDITISSGIGTYQMDIELRQLPPKTSLIKGYVHNSSGEVMDAMVVVMDPITEISNYTLTDEEGLYELGFWEGRHFLISMLQDHDTYFHSIELGPDETIWMNFTLKEEIYHVTGIVRGPDGSAIEDVEGQYFTQNGFPEDNSDTTNQDGVFDFWTGEGTGFLIAADDDPFESGDHDVYFRQLNVSSDLDLEIDLSEKDVFTMEMDLAFSNWSHFSSTSKFRFPENNSKAIKAMIDLMVGDGDLYVTVDEIDAWYEFLVAEDNEIEEGPFGTSTGDDLTVDDRSFQLIGNKVDVTLTGFNGRVGDPVNGSIRIDAEYECEPFRGPFVSHIIRSNITYDKEKEETKIRVFYPNLAHLQEVKATTHHVQQVDTYPPFLIIEPSIDLDPEDEKDSEWLDLSFHNRSFSARLEAIEEYLYFGEYAHFEVNITEDPIPDNNYSFNWSLAPIIEGNEGNYTSIAVTYGPSLNYSFEDEGPGKYYVKVQVTDSIGRSYEDHEFIEIYHAIPIVTLQVEGGPNQTFYEGQVINVTANITFDPGYPIQIWWDEPQAGRCEYDELGDLFRLNYSDDNRTTRWRLIDQGIISFRLHVNGHQSTVWKHINITVLNIAPTIEYEVLENGNSSDLEVYQGDTVFINVTSKTDPGKNDDVRISWDGPISEEQKVHTVQGMPYLEYRTFIFTEPGTYNITINATDGDGGYDEHIISIKVLEVYDYDQDGDGLPNWYEMEKGFSVWDPADASLDPDNDNWTNLQEFENFTDPFKDDTDEDGVPDPWDENPLNDNILGFDTDKDGVSDWDEMKEDTDPNDPEDYPGKKDENSYSPWIWLSLILAGVMIFVGVFVYALARKNQKMMEYEE